MRLLSRSLLFVLLLSISLGGCVTFQPKSESHRTLFLSGQPEAALAALDHHPSSRDSLLRYMEKGSILHNLEKYEESAKEFRLATQLMDDQDYISVANETKSLLANQWINSYKGEYSEQLWVHTYQMMNYLLLEQYENAAVEARQSLKVLDRYSKPLEGDWFSQALIALSFESVGKINDAHIEYKKLAEKLPNAKPVAKQIYDIAQQLGISKDAQKYQSSISDSQWQLKSGEYGELIVFLANGAIPEKVSSSLIASSEIRVSFPAYLHSDEKRPRYSVHSSSEEFLFTEITSSLGAVAKKSLNARGKSILARTVLRASAKHSLAENLKKEHEVAGELLSLLFWVLEEADTRGWSTLPANLTVLRIPLKPGVHDLEISNGNVKNAISNLTIQSGKKVYRKIRF